MFELERDLFRRFAEGCRLRPVIVQEFVDACRVVNTRYDTAIYENRFIVGGVVEQLIGAAMRAQEVPIQNVAKTRRGVDLMSLQHPVGFSVKSQFKRGQEIRMVNTMGGSGREVVWDHATIFVLVGTGIGYADPELASHGLVPRSDALTLKIASLRELWSRKPELLISCDIPAKPEDTLNSRVASDVVAQDVLLEFKNLLVHYQPER